jgi:phosphatidylethanolamine N-methyltransferase
MPGRRYSPMKFLEYLVPLTIQVDVFPSSLRLTLGWFFGDFFIEDYPATLVYTGIYRCL